jgi:hypothetical protein
VKKGRKSPTASKPGTRGGLCAALAPPNSPPGAGVESRRVQQTFVPPGEPTGDYTRPMFPLGGESCAC